MSSPKFWDNDSAWVLWQGTKKKKTTLKFHMHFYMCECVCIFLGRESIVFITFLTASPFPTIGLKCCSGSPSVPAMQTREGRRSQDSLDLCPNFQSICRFLSEWCEPPLQHLAGKWETKTKTHVWVSWAAYPEANSSQVSSSAFLNTFTATLTAGLPRTASRTLTIRGHLDSPWVWRGQVRNQQAWSAQINPFFSVLEIWSKASSTR